MRLKLNQNWIRYAVLFKEKQVLILQWESTMIRQKFCLTEYFQRKRKGLKLDTMTNGLVMRKNNIN